MRMSRSKTMRLVSLMTTALRGSILLVLLAGAIGAPASAHANLLTNGDFETTPYDTGWVVTDEGIESENHDAFGTAETANPISGTTSARFSYNTIGEFQQVIAPQSDFVVDLKFKQVGNTVGRTLNLLLHTNSDIENNSAAINLRVLVQSGADQHALQVFDGVNGQWHTLVDPSVFAFNSTTESYRIAIQGYDWGGANPTYDVLWSEAGSNDLVHALTGLEIYQGAPTGGLERLRFSRPFSTANSWMVDDVSVTAVAVPAPGALAGGTMLLVMMVLRQRNPGAR